MQLVSQVTTVETVFQLFVFDVAYNSTNRQTQSNYASMMSAIISQITMTSEITN